MAQPLEGSCQFQPLTSSNAVLIFRSRKGIQETLGVGENSVAPSSMDWNLFDRNSQAAKASKPNAIYADHVLNNLSEFLVS